MTEANEAYISASQISRLLHIHTNTLRRWAAEGKIERCPPIARGQWFFRREDIENLCRKQETQGAEDVLVWKVKVETPQRLNYISPSVSRVLGYTQAEAMGMSMQDAFSGASLGRMGKAMAEELPKLDAKRHAELALTLNLELIHKNGSLVPATASFSYMYDASGTPSEIQAVARINVRQTQAVTAQLNTQFR